ncbi:T-cell surface glycoprotein CD3 zeta chain isoform 1-T1 [Synchiropus picturatus]
MKLLVTLLILFPQTAEALSLSSPLLCFILDGFLGIYGLIVTGLLIKEKLFKRRNKDISDGDNKQYSDAGPGAKRRLQKHQMNDDSTYTGLSGGREEYRELPVKPDRQRRGNEEYEELRRDPREQYDALRMKNRHTP